MNVPERFRRHVTEEEWARLGLESLPVDDRRMVEAVLLAIVSVPPTDEEDRRRAVEATIRYREQLVGLADLHEITMEETIDAIRTAGEVIDGLRRDPGAVTPDPPANADGEQQKPR